MKYRPDIDGLRAIAVLAVLLFHGHVPGTDGGFVGVDVFFVISGYLICGLVANDIAKQRFSLLKFYERRFRRIMPALLAMTSVTFCAAVFILLPRDALDFCRSLIATALFFSNIHFWQNIKYFDGASEFKPLLHTWSLGVEEQFYIFMPLILFCIARWAKSRYALWLFPLSLASFGLSVWGLSNAPTASFYLLPTRFWELSIGAFLSVSLPPLSMPRKLAEGISAVGLVSIIYGVVSLSEESPFPGWNALLPCLGTAAIILAGTQTPTVISRVLASGPMVFIGKISYPLYLWHWPILALMKYQLGRELTALDIAVAMAATLLFSILSWRVVETPIRQNTRLFNTRYVFAGSVVGILLITGLGSVGVLSRGFAFRYPELRRVETAEQVRFNRVKCLLTSSKGFQDWRGAECFLTRGRTQNVLLWGDSFAAHYAPGIIAAGEKVTVNVLQYTADACPPVFGYSSAALPHCQEFNDNVTNVLAKYDISAIVMVSRWESIFKRGTSPAAVGATVQRLNELGHKVFVVGQSPVYYNNVQILFEKAGLAQALDASAPITFKRDLNSRIAAVVPPGSFIDPLPALCGPRDCMYMQQGRYIVIDVGHFSSFGSELAVRSYFPFYSERQ